MPQSPNVIFIYADDIGYGDLSCNGAKTICTPHVERLAAELQMRPEELRAAAEGGPAGGVKDERALRVLRRAYGEAMASVVEHALSKGGGASMHQAYLKNYGALGGEGGEGKAPVCFVGGDRLEE